MFKSTVLALMLTATITVAQERKPLPGNPVVIDPKGAVTDQPRRQGPTMVQCEDLKKLMEQVRNHRATCESCKTNLPPRGPMGPRGEGRRQGPPRNN